MDPYTAITIAEGIEEVDRAMWIRAWQHLIDTGLVWKLQGCFGRQARALIEEGICHLPEK